MSIKHITFDAYGYIAGTSITNLYQTVVTMTDDADFLFVFNTTDKALIMRVPSGTASTREVRLPAGANFSLDCRTNSKRLAKGLIEIKYASDVPTSGEFCITVAR